MYKFSIIFGVFFLLGAGCASTAPSSSMQVKKADISLQSSTQSPTENTMNNREERTLVGQTDLAGEYSKAVLKTNKGDITISFYADASPKTVNNFLNLAKDGLYDNTKFHRVIQDFMIQGGDPLTKEDSAHARWGTGDPGYKFPDEFNTHKLVRGSLAMANSGPNTNGSQFFIVTASETPWLDGKHVNFGEVADGMDVVDAIEHTPTKPGDVPVEAISIIAIELVK